MQQTIERFLAESRRYFLERNEAVVVPEPDSGQKEVKQMRAMDERSKHNLARRMKDVVANPPQRVFARELLARGMTANEVWQLVMHDAAFVSVPESFRIAVANAARELANERLLAAARRPSSGGRSPNA